MPIDLRTHDPSENVSLSPGTNKAAIIRLLYTNPHYGFRPAEIHDRLGEIPKGSITATLTRLLEGGYIGKTTDGYYHALENRDDLRRFARGLVQVRDLTTRYEDDLSSDDIEQVGEKPKNATSSKTEVNATVDEPEPEEWIESVDDSNRD